MAKGRMEKGENLSIRSWLNTELKWKEGQNGHGMMGYMNISLDMAAEWTRVRLPEKEFGYCGPLGKPQ